MMKRATDRIAVQLSVRQNESQAVLRDKNERF